MSQPQSPGVPPVYGPPPGWGAAAPQTAPAGYLNAPTAPGDYVPAPPAGHPAQQVRGYAPAMPHPGNGYAPPVPQPGSAQPYHGQAGQGGQMAFTACRFCGSVPAVEAKFRGHQGMLVIMRFLSTEGPFCRDCGLGVFRHMTSRTLVQGWYGYASFVITPITVLMNLVRRGKVAGLAAPQPHPYAASRPPMDPGPRLLQRPLTWVGLAIPFALVVLLVVVASTD